MRVFLPILVVIATLAAPPALAKGKKANGHVAVGLDLPIIVLDVRKKTDPEAPEAEDAQATYWSNPPTVGFVELSWYDVTVTVSKAVQQGESPDETDSELSLRERTRSEYDALELSWFGDWIGIDGSRARLKGFYLDQVTGADKATLDQDPSAVRSDLTVATQGGNIWLAPLAHNLTLSEYFDTSSARRGFGIGLLAVGSYDTLTVDSSAALVPDAYAAAFGRDAGFTGGTFVSTTVQLGPALSLDYGGAYFGFMFLFGSGDQVARYQVAGETYEEKKTAEKTNAYVAAGYKGETFYLVYDYSQDEPTYALETATVSLGRLHSRFTLGWRF